MAEAAIEAIGLVKRFGASTALAGLALRVERGSLYGLVGPDGAGKTTAVRILTGIDRSSSGVATVLGRRMPDRRVRARIGYMPQDVALYADLTVRQNLSLFAELHGMAKEEIGVREAELLELVGLLEYGNDLLSRLSGDAKRRVSLAASLIHDPELLILDEPTAGADPELRASFWGHYARLRDRGVTILLTTHGMEEASRCDRVGLLRGGLLLAEGSPDEVQRKAGASTLEEAYLALARRGRSGQ
jgi:ABC-2 type transport system ATP-binding protein